MEGFVVFDYWDRYEEAAKIAVAGATGFADDVDYSLHLTCDLNNAGDAKWRLEEVRRIVATTKSGKEMEPIIPKVVRAQPFKHVGEFLVGHDGERWIPIHACLPASKLVPVVPGATDAVIGMLGDLAEIFMEHGAVNQQIGKFYPYKDAMAADTWSLPEDIKRLGRPGRTHESWQPWT